MRLGSMLRWPLVFVGTALALPALAGPPNFDWSGLYFGVQGGLDSANIAASGEASAASFETITGTALGNDQSWALGGFAGFRFQTGQGFVLGAEADLNWANLATRSEGILGLTSSGSCADTTGVSTFICVDEVSTGVKWYGTARGTIGHAFGPFLLYGTAGLAYGEVQSSVDGRWKITTVVPDDPLFGSRNSEVRFGWAAGLGGALAISDRVSLRLEWLHVDLGDRTVASASGFVQPTVQDNVPYAVVIKEDVNIDAIRLGLSVHIP